jgi:hypothetical protein
MMSDYDMSIHPNPVAWAWTVNNGAGYTSRGIGFEQTDIPFAKHVPLYTAPPLPDYNIKLEQLREMVKVQGYNGNWNFDPYKLGMYNGMEFMLAMLENRGPVFKTRPDVWLCELPLDKVIGEINETMG